MSVGGSVRVVIYALFANLGIALAKFMGAFISGSTALLAEAVHSLVDCANQGLLLVGNKASKKLPTETHPLGYGREAYFWSFVVSIMLFSLGGVFSIYEGSHKLSQLEPVSSSGLGVAILVVAIVLEAFSFMACLNEVRRQNNFGSLWKWFRKTTTADLLVVFTEDLAALVGLIIALVCIILSWITADPVWDARGSIFIGILLVGVASILAVEVKSLLIGEAPDRDVRTTIDAVVSQFIPDGRVLKLLALQVGNAEILVSYKISCGSIITAAELVRVINKIEQEVKRRIPDIKWQFVEPDIAN